MDIKRKKKIEGYKQGSLQEIQMNPSLMMFLHISRVF